MLLFTPLLLLAAGVDNLFAQLPLARLLTVFPPGGKAGTTFQVSFTGSDLDDASRLYFSHSNITSKPKLVNSGAQPEASAFEVTIASNVPPGVYEARVVGRFGASNPRAFIVGDRPEAIEASTNNAASAMEIAPGTVVNGHADVNAVDYYRFAAKQGQRLLIDCQGKDIDSRIEAAMELFDAHGREIDRTRPGDLLDFTAPGDGQYLLKVHDFVYRGGEEYFYRLSLGTGPHIDFIFPPSGLAGAKGKFVLYGRNLPGSTPANGLTLDGKSLEQLTVEIELPRDAMSRQRLSTSLPLTPSGSAIDGIEYRLPTPQGMSNPVLFSFATGAVVPEQEPNNQPELAQKISLPCEFVGQFYPQGDQDWVTFEGKKGEVFWVEVFSQRLGLPTDPFVLIQRVQKNSKGEEKISDLQEVYESDTNIGGREFDTRSRDPATRFEVTEDGSYRLAIRDLFNRFQDDPRHVYRLSLRKETPDFRLAALPQSPPAIDKDKKEATLWSTLVRRGETVPVKVLAFRQDNFRGDIQLSAQGLPSGVSCSLTTMDPNQNSATLLFTAAENAAGWVGPIQIVGRATIVDAEAVREARGGSLIWNVGDYSAEGIPSRMTRDLILAVSGSETTPLAIEPGGKNLWETSVAGKLQIPLKIVRRAEFNTTFKLKAAGLSALDSLKELEVDAKATNATLELDLTQHKLAPGTYCFHLQTQTKGKYARLPPDEAKAAEDAAKQAEKIAADLAAAAKKAEETLAAATKAAGEAASLAKEAEKKLAACRKAADTTPPSDDLIAARTAAEKLAADASAKSKAAAEAKAAVEKPAAEATAKSKNAEAKKSAAATHSKEAGEKAKPKEVTVTCYSAPLNLKVTAAPIALSVGATTGQLEPGSKLEVPVIINRLYQFNDPVELSLLPPKGITGLNAAKTTIAKNQSQGKLVIEAASNATLGNHKLTIQAALKLNNQDLRVDETIALKVAVNDQAKTK